MKTSALPVADCSIVNLYVNCPACGEPIPDGVGSFLIDVGNLNKHDAIHCPSCGAKCKSPRWVLVHAYDA